MSVKLKDSKVTDEKGTIINFNAEDFKAVKGLKGSFFEGKIKVVHSYQADKLVASKRAEIVKAELVKEENENRSVKDVKTK
jgi:hypothetical protein